MFNRLLESNKKRQRRLGGAVASTIFHTLLIALAVKATQLTATPAPKTRPIPKILYADPTPKPPAPKQTTPPSGARPTAVDPLLPPPAAPAPQIKLAFDGVPISTIDPTAVNSNVFGRTSITEIGDGSNGTPNDNSTGPLTREYVDIPILAIPGTGNPRYPATLQSAGLEGDVRAQFVVDTLGRVERGSVRVLDTTHELFAAAVRDALTRAKFKPAEAGGHLVRQLAEQTFTFRITK